MVKACSGHQFGLCRQFTYRTIILPTVYLWVFVSHRQDNLADWLPLAEFAYNNKVHSATCWTLFELDTGQHLCLGVEPMRTSTVEAVDAFARQLGHAQEEAKAALK